MLQYINYILLDAARMGDAMDEAKEMNAQHDSLYRGSSEESLHAVAPYAFSFAAGTPFANWYMEQGWGDAWGVMLKSSLTMPELHKHFRKFLLIKAESGKELYFRFYDPRVLRIFLPTCNATQLTEFFGAIDYFILEDEDPAFAIRFWLENATLRSQQMRRAELLQPAVAKQTENISKPDVVQPAKPAKPKWNMFD